jgi:hypothetical protein
LEGAEDGGLGVWVPAQPVSRVRLMADRAASGRRFMECFLFGMEWAGWS